MTTRSKKNLKAQIFTTSERRRLIIEFKQKTKTAYLSTIAAHGDFIYAFDAISNYDGMIDLGEKLCKAARAFYFEEDDENIIKLAECIFISYVSVFAD